MSSDFRGSSAGCSTSDLCCVVVCSPDEGTSFDCCRGSDGSSTAGGDVDAVANTICLGGSSCVDGAMRPVRISKASFGISRSVTLAQRLPSELTGDVGVTLLVELHERYLL